MPSPVSERKVKSGAKSPSRATGRSLHRALGIVRVSRVGERAGESFASPTEQAERIRAECERQGFELIEPLVRELDVSGGTPLAKCEGLRRAVEAVEAGEADVLVVAYLDRLVRSLTVQAEVVQRVEAAGGRIRAVDIGDLTEATAGSWLSGTMRRWTRSGHKHAEAA